MSRLDAWLVEGGYFSSRARAKAAILSGRVFIDGSAATRASQPAPEETADMSLSPSAKKTSRSERVFVAAAGEGDEYAFVSRGGAKLDAALEAFDIDVTGLEAIDFGASTGGFTDCLLKRGAARVYCVDVGEGQLHESLRADSRVVLRENVNIRSLVPGQINGGRCGFAVVDVSFISLKLVLKPVFEQLAGGFAVCLVKPQFELGPGRVGKRGVVKTTSLREEALESVVSYAKTIGLTPIRSVASNVQGGDGNQEFFLYVKR